VNARPARTSSSRNIGIFGAGLRVYVSESLSLFGGCDVQAGGNQLINMGSGGLRLTWKEQSEFRLQRRFMGPVACGWPLFVCIDSVSKTVIPSS